MRRPSTLARLVLPLALVAALPVVAAQVYTWKDAKGVTHYSDAPPAGQKMKPRAFGEHAATPPAAPKAVVNQDCTNARSNLTLLQGTGKVGVDEDKDGKADREITASERAARLKVAEGQVELYCTGPSAGVATTKQT
ncbi:DUF4124 domain-containing protein [Lysobacter sp. TY2-98]|uniref:DUF4124 domain-containing protein n=1 Tax=Lysobacter sp. TY2-98 TaxID=2290922 RepID=UPI000E201293|nr:DUF4124 domain-containing protein [Lysobacter sp. TY2-98]AXK70913.1 DUF4124 domain-containing protein [Lysobacter sp. TY2-98]